jgi:hypothetical protein
MIRTVCHGISSVKELEKVKKEEAERKAERLLSDRSSLTSSFVQIPDSK